MHRRRRVLALLGSAGASGCLGSVSAPGTPRTGTQTNGSLGCPPFDSDVKRVVCAPDTEKPPLALTPAEQWGLLPYSELSFALTNRTGTTFEVNFYGWSVWKHVEGEWYRVAPRTWPVPLMSLPPEASHEWHLTVDNTDLDRPIPPSEGTRDVTVVGLGAGTYAFGTDGWFEDHGHHDKTAVAARFELTGDPLPLTAVGIDRTERDGDTVVVYDEPVENEDRAEYVVTRVENPSAEPRRMITEQVVRETELRNALAHFEPEVQQVRLVGGTTTYPPFGVHEPRYVEYEGETYSVEAERLDAETSDS